MNTRTPPSSTEPMRLSLNRSERMYLGVEGVAGSLTQVYAVRFTAPIDAFEVRDALRSLVRANPRLRAVVEPTLLGHRLRVHPEGRAVDSLFAHAFREEALPSTDDAALTELMSRLLAEPFAVERDLPIKAHFVAHASRPALVLSVHHIAGDGRSVMGWIRSLHQALEGEELAAVPLDPPGHLPALLPSSLADVPRALLEEARALARNNPFAKHLTAPRQAIPGFGPIAVHAHRLSVPAATVVASSRARGTTVGTLSLSAAALAFHRLVPDGDTDVVRARLSIDLRDLYPEGRAPGYGNYVSSFLVDIDPRDGIAAMIPQIDATMRANIEGYKRRSRMMTSLAREASSSLGRHQTGRAALLAKSLGRHKMQSFHFSNLGRADGFESGRVPFDCVLPSVSHPDLLIGLLGFRGQLQTVFTYPSAEVSVEFVRSLGAAMDDVLAELAAQDASPIAREPTRPDESP